MRPSRRTMRTWERPSECCASGKSSVSVPRAVTSEWAAYTQKETMTVRGRCEDVRVISLMIMVKFARSEPTEERHWPCCNVNFLPFSLFSSADHRRVFHHTHHPLSTHLPQRTRRRPPRTDRRRRKKQKKKKTSLPPSAVTPTIQEVDEEEVQSETDATDVTQTPSQVKWISGEKQKLPGHSEDLIYFLWCALLTNTDIQILLILI